MTSSPTSLIFMLIVIVLIGVALLAIFALTRGRGRVLDKEKYQAEWLSIENQINKNNDASYQFAILSADKLLDQALRETGVRGDTMGERLKKSNSLLQDINGVWAAHKLRNRIAHEVNAPINKPVAKRMLTIYKNALKDLGAI